MKTTRDLKAYLDEIGKYPALTREEEINLARRIKKGDKLAKKKFIESNLKLVLWVIKRDFSLVWPKIPIEDLIQAGNIGLMKAVEKFNPDKGVKFSTYAKWWIRVEIERYIGKQIGVLRVPEKILLTPKENKPLEAQNALSPISLESNLSPDENDEFTLEEILPLENNIEVKVRREEIRKKLIKLIKSLPPKEAIVLQRRMGFFGNRETLAQIAKDFNCSKEAVRKMEKRAIKRLKSKIEFQELKREWQSLQKEPS